MVAFEVQQRCFLRRDARPEGSEPFFHFLSHRSCS
jgi:hypothetical protein